MNQLSRRIAQHPGEFTLAVCYVAVAAAIHSVVAITLAAVLLVVAGMRGALRRRLAPGVGFRAHASEASVAPRSSLGG